MLWGYGQACAVIVLPTGNYVHGNGVLFLMRVLPVSMAGGAVPKTSMLGIKRVYKCNVWALSVHIADSSHSI